MDILDHFASIRKASQEGVETCLKSLAELQVIMARKSKSSASPKWFMLLGIGAFFLFIATLVFTGGEKGAVRTLDTLDVPSYMENANSLRGNTYQLNGIVAESLVWSKDAGRLIAVEVDDNIVPVLISPEFNTVNIQKQQKLIFTIEVDDKGILRAKKVSKA